MRRKLSAFVRSRLAPLAGLGLVIMLAGIAAAGGAMMKARSVPQPS